MNEHPDFFSLPSSPQSASTSPEFWALDDNTTDLPSLEDTAVTYPVVTDSFSSFFPPEFEYILPATDRYVLVLDRSQTSAQPVRLFFLSFFKVFNIKNTCFAIESLESSEAIPVPMGSCSPERDLLERDRIR